MRLRTLASAALLPAAVHLAAARAGAQSDTTAAAASPIAALGVPIGSRVQVRATGSRRIEGTLAAVRGDTLDVRIGADTAGPATPIALAEVHRLAVSRGRRTPGEAAASGALRGFAIGAGATVALTAAAYWEGRRQGDVGANIGMGLAALYGMVATVGLTARGAVVGRRDPGDHWQRVSLPRRVRAAVGPAPGGAALGVRVGF